MRIEQADTLPVLASDSKYPTVRVNSSLRHQKSHYARLIHRLLMTTRLLSLSSIIATVLCGL